MGVGGHEGHPVGRHLAVDAAHLLVHLVVRGGENGLVDSIHQGLAVHHHTARALGHRHGGIRGGVEAGKVILALARGYLDVVVALVHVEGQRHIVEGFQDVQECLPI